MVARKRTPKTGSESKREETTARQFTLKNAAPSELTPHEQMRLLDARLLRRLAQELITCMPPSYKEAVRKNGGLSIQLDEHEVAVYRSG